MFYVYGGEVEYEKRYKAAIFFNFVASHSPYKICRDEVKKDMFYMSDVGIVKRNII